MFSQTVPPEPTAEELCVDGALSLDSAAAFCDLSKREIERAIERGELKTLYHGRKPLIPKRTLVLWLAAKLEATQAANEPPNASRATHRG